MNEKLYLGIDIGKNTHVVAFLNRSILTKRHHSACPLLKVEQSRTGFMNLLKEIRQYAPEDTYVLLESTGHYGAAIEQFLQEYGMHLFRIQAKKKYGRDKTDELDARKLALKLYNQEELQTIPDDDIEIRRLAQPSDAARMLRSFVRHHYELTVETTQRKNKLTSISDELFPELASIYTDLNSLSALALREQFPLPSDIANAPIDALCATRLRTFPSRARLIEMQELARQTIGTKDKSRLYALVIEQRMLIAELRLLQKHIDRLEIEIEAIISSSREGQILRSFKGVGPVQAAILLAHLGGIANFESASKLKGYIGWAPKRAQTGTSKDSVVLAKGGNMFLKRTLFMITMTAIQHDPTWKQLHQRLVPRLCRYDARTKKHVGKMKVIGRVAGQIIKVMYILLKKDHDLLADWTSSDPPPPPTLYDAALHVVKAGES